MRAEGCWENLDIRINKCLQSSVCPDGDLVLSHSVLVCHYSNDFTASIANTFSAIRVLTCCNLSQLLT